MPNSTTQDPQTTRKLHLILGQGAALEARFGQLRGRPVRGSKLDHDRKWPHGSLTWTSALGRWGNAMDHLFAWNVLLGAGVQPERAHYSLARSALEAAVICRWLVDPRAEPADRRARGARWQLQDHAWRRQFEEMFRKEEGEEVSAGSTATADGRAKSAAVRHARLKSEMVTLGMSLDQPPAMSALFRDYAIGGWFYGLLSAYAHGQQWSLLTAKLTDRVRLPGMSGALHVRAVANDELTLAAAAETISAMRLAMEELEAYSKVPRRKRTASRLAV